MGPGDKSVGYFRSPLRGLSRAWAPAANPGRVPHFSHVVVHSSVAGPDTESVEYVIELVKPSAKLTGTIGHTECGHFSRSPRRLNAKLPAPEGGSYHDTTDLPGLQRDHTA
jgi:hypothetical protein